MSTDDSNINDSINTQTSDFDGFINEPPYNFCWAVNNNGAKVPIFPYVISVVEPKSINAIEEKTLRSYLEALIKNWKWKKEIPIIVIADKSGRTGEIVLETINFFKNQLAKRNSQKDANQQFFVRFQDQAELISRFQNETANDSNSLCYSNTNAHLTIVFWQRENDENSQKSNIDAIKDHLRSLYPGFNEHTLNSVLQIQPDNPDSHNNNSSLPVYYYNIKNHSKNKVKAPSKLMKSLSNKNDLNNLKKINDVSLAFNKSAKSAKAHLFDTQDNSIIQLLKISSYFHRLSDFCKKQMKHYTNIFCFAFLLLFMCNALFVYINSSCINSFGASVFQLARYCSTGDNDNYFYDNVLTYKLIPIKIQTRISNDVIKSKIEILKTSYISFHFFKISKAIFICTVFWFLIIAALPPLFLIVRCIYVHCVYYWHKKYHNCQTLSDCLKIQAYLKYAGIQDNVCKDNFLSKQVPGWLSAAMIGIYASIPFDCHNSSVNNLEEYKKRIEYLDKRWLKKYVDKYRQRIYKSGWNALELFSKVGVLLWSFVTFFFILFFIISHKYSRGFVWSSFRALIVAVLVFSIFGLLYYWSRSWAESNNIIQRIVRRIQKFDMINFVLICSIILCCFAGLFESHRLSNICTLSQNSCLSDEDIFPFISDESKNEEFILIRNLVISFVLIAFAFQRMEMFYKERKIIFQLFYSFKNTSADIHKLFIDSNKQNQLLDMTKNRNAYYSDVIKRINDCMIQPSDIVSILENIKLQKQPAAAVSVPSNESFIKRTWNLIRAYFSFKRTIEAHQPAAVQDDYVKKIELELNNLRENKMKNFLDLREHKYNNPNVQMDSVIIVECQNILLRLGEEYLTKRIDWLLDVRDRDLKPPKS